MNYASDFSDLYSRCGNKASAFVSLYNGNKYNLMQPGFRKLDGVNASFYEAKQLLKVLRENCASYQSVSEQFSDFGSSSVVDHEDLVKLVNYINVDIEKIKQRNREIKAGLKNEMIEILEDALNGVPFSGSMLHRTEALEYKIKKIVETKLTDEKLFDGDAINRTELEKDLSFVIAAFRCSKDGLESYMDSLKDPFSNKNLGMYATDQQIAALTPEERATIRQYRVELEDTILRGLNHLINE